MFIQDREPKPLKLKPPSTEEEEEDGIGQVGEAGSGKGKDTQEELRWIQTGGWARAGARVEVAPMHARRKSGITSAEPTWASASMSAGEVSLQVQSTAFKLPERRYSEWISRTSGPALQRHSHRLVYSFQQ